MADIELKYGTTTSLTVTGLATLANSTSATSATVDNTANLFIDLLVEIIVSVGVGAVATGVVEIYAKGSIDNADFDDDANDKWVGTVALAAAGAATYKRIVSLASAFGGSLPPFVQLRVRNATGAALTAGTAAYRGVLMQSV